MGTPFLRAYMSIFDMDEHRVGFISCVSVFIEYDVLVVLDESSLLFVLLLRRFHRMHRDLEPSENRAGKPSKHWMSRHLGPIIGGVVAAVVVVVILGVLLWRRKKQKCVANK